MVQQNDSNFLVTKNVVKHHHMDKNSLDEHLTLVHLLDVRNVFALVDVLVDILKDLVIPRMDYSFMVDNSSGESVP